MPGLSDSSCLTDGRQPTGAAADDESANHVHVPEAELSLNAENRNPFIATSRPASAGHHRKTRAAATETRKARWTPCASAANRGAEDAMLESSETLTRFDSKQLLFCGCSLLLLSVIWLGVVIALYATSVQTTANIYYESRWLLSTLLITGSCALGLYFYRYATLFIAVAVAATYSIASAFVTLLAYCLNLQKMFAQERSEFLSSAPNFARALNKHFLQLCLCLIVLCSFAILLSFVLLRKLFKISFWFFKAPQLPERTPRILFTLGCVEICLALFSVYVTTQMMTAKVSHIQTYMIQELHCSFVLLLIGLAQIGLSFRSASLLLKSLLLLTACQFIQELFYTWNAYYMALYLHANKIPFAVSLEFDQVIITSNFVDHVLRLIVTGNVCLQLAFLVRFPRSGLTAKLTLELDASTQRFLTYAAATFFLLGGCHVIQDVIYTSMEHLYRTLIAFTGVSVFYATATGIALSVFLRKRCVLYLILSCFFASLLFCISVHGVYVYLDTTFSGNLIRHLEALDKDPIKPSLMHFVEGLFAFAGLLLSAVAGFAMFRLLRLASDHVAYDKLGLSVKTLLCLGVAMLSLTLAETLILLFVRDHWRLFDTTMAYNVMDVLSMFATAVLQIYVALPSNRHTLYLLLVLMLILLAEVLTTFNYLNTYTTYVQLLIMLYRLMGGQGVGPSKLTTLFSLSHIVPFILNHVIQLLQWFIAICSVLACGVVVESIDGCSATARATTDEVGNGSANVASSSAASLSTATSDVCILSREHESATTSSLKSRHVSTSSNNCAQSLAFDNPAMTADGDDDTAFPI